MRGTVIGIESGAKYIDKQRRVAFRILDADTGWSELRIPEDKLPSSMRGVQLDYEVEVTLEVARAPIPQHSLPDAHLEGCGCPNCTDVRAFEHSAGMSL